MLFSRKSILIKGKKPLYAATKVLNASSATASSAFAKCWVHSTNKTRTLFKTVRTQSQGFRRAYSTKFGGTGSESESTPLYRALSSELSCVSADRLGRKACRCMDKYADEMVSATHCCWCPAFGSNSIPEKIKTGGWGGRSG